MSPSIDRSVRVVKRLGEPVGFHGYLDRSLSCREPIAALSLSGGRKIEHFPTPVQVGKIPHFQFSSGCVRLGQVRLCSVSGFP